MTELLEATKIIIYSALFDWQIFFFNFTENRSFIFIHKHRMIVNMGSGNQEIPSFEYMHMSLAQIWRTGITITRPCVHHVFNMRINLLIGDHS